MVRSGMIFLRLFKKMKLLLRASAKKFSQVLYLPGHGFRTRDHLKISPVLCGACLLHFQFLTRHAQHPEPSSYHI